MLRICRTEQCARGLNNVRSLRALGSLETAGTTPRQVGPRSRFVEERPGFDGRGIMSLLSLSDVAVSYGATDILDGVTCEANLGERIGLVGRNGAGKTTLLRVLSGNERRRHLGKTGRAFRLRSCRAALHP